VFTPGAGLPDFFWYNKPKRGIYIPMDYKVYQMVTKGLKKRQKGPKIYQHIPLQDTTNFTQIGIFGLKINHLATMPHGCTSG
jgi:hypothetical protein